MATGAILGGNTDDDLVGSGADDSICGLEGNDTLRGFAGADTIEGNDGNDQISGGAGNDMLFAGAGNDTLLGGGGDDFLDLGELSAGDSVNGNSGDDTLVFSLSNDGPSTVVIRNSELNLDGASIGASAIETYNITMSDQGDSVFVSNGATNSDTISVVGGAGKDRLIFDTLFGRDVSIDTNGGTAAISGGTTVNYSGIEVFATGRGDDDVIGSDADEVFNLGDGDDTAELGGGNDVLFLGSGFNSVDGGAGSDRLSFSPLDEGVVIDMELEIAMTDSGDITNFTGFENIIGSNSDDLLIGDSGRNIISSLGGGDIVIGGGGNDVLVAGTGAGEIDTFIFDIGSDRDTVNQFAAGAGGDVLDISAYGFVDLAEVAEAANGSRLTLSEDGDQIFLRGVDFADLVDENFVFAPEIIELT